MKAINIILAVGLLMPLACIAVNVDDIFDAQEKTSTTSTTVDSGVYKNADGSANAVKQRAEEKRRARDEAAREYAERTAAERAVGNGNRYYKCSFYCRESGFVSYDSTNRMTLTIKADEQWQADHDLEHEAKEICNKAHGNMWPSGEHCEEVR